MKTLENYVESRLNFESAEKDFINELCDILDIGSHQIKTMRMRSSQTGNVIHQIIAIEFGGTIRMTDEQIAKIGKCNIILPHELEIEVGEIHL